MTNQPVPQQEPTTDSALLAVAETVSDVTMQLRDDIDLVAHVCASHDQALLQLIEEVDRLRVANAQLFIRIRHLERR